MEENAKRVKEETQRNHLQYLKMEEQRRETEKFNQHMKEVGRKVIEANECVKLMRKNI